MNDTLTCIAWSMSRPLSGVTDVRQIMLVGEFLIIGRPTNIHRNVFAYGITSYVDSNIARRRAVETTEKFEQMGFAMDIMPTVRESAADATATRAWLDNLLFSKAHSQDHLELRRVFERVTQQGERLDGVA